MLYYLDSFSNVNTFSSASIHTIKQSFPVPSRVFFILLIKRTLQIFITTAEKRALVTCLPPYKALQTSRSYIYVSFQQITPKLGIFTDSCKDFLPSRVEGLSLTAGHIKSWKTRGRIYLPCCTHSWGLKLCGHVLKSFLSKRCTSLQDRTRACADLLYCLVRRAYVLVKTYQKKLSYLQSIKENIAKCTPAKDLKALTQSPAFPFSLTYHQLQDNSKTLRFFFKDVWRSMHCKMVRSSGFQERPQLAFFYFIKKTFRIRLKRKTSSQKLNELVSKRERYSFAGVWKSQQSLLKGY